MKRFILALSVAVLALSSVACRAVPVLRGDLDDATEEIRKEERSVDEAQQDAFRDYLIAHPGDIEGATAAAFGTAIATRDGQDASRPPQEEGGNLPLEELLLILFGGGTVGTILTRILRGAPLRSGSGIEKQGTLVAASSAPPAAPKPAA